MPPVKLFFPDEDITKIKEDVEKILRSGMLTLNVYTKQFEESFARLCGVKHAVAVNSGTSALEISLRSMKLKAGDEVLVPTNTFTSTAATVFFAGGKPVFTDINPSSLCIDASNVEKYITPKTKGVIAVHMGGLVCPDIDEIKKICDDRGIFLIEDAAHAHGSRLNGKSAGSFGDTGCFSFYPTKVMTCGEGGIITTNSDEVASKAMVLRDQGKESFNSNTIVELGYNWRMNEISAAIGLTQLERLPEIIEKRNQVAKIFNDALGNVQGVTLLKNPANLLHNYYKYILLLDENISRDKCKENLRSVGVKCGGEIYWPPLHMQPIYQELLGTRTGDFPMAEKVCKAMLALPMYAQMAADEAQYVSDKVKEVVLKMEGI